MALLLSQLRWLSFLWGVINSVFISKSPRFKKVSLWLCTSWQKMPGLSEWMSPSQQGREKHHFPGAAFPRELARRQLKKHTANELSLREQRGLLYWAVTSPKADEGRLWGSKAARAWNVSGARSQQAPLCPFRDGRLKLTLNHLQLFFRKSSLK